jgi:tyrosinase
LADFGLSTQPTPVSTYDLFVIWHFAAMFTYTPSTQSDRNAAHSGSVFLPWHRFMLLLLEFQMQRVLGDPDFGLPYWDWAADGELDVNQQPTSPLWADDCLGGNGSPVTTGPFKYDAADPTSWRVRIDTNVNGRLSATDRGLQRTFQASSRTLPKKVDVRNALANRTYDSNPWQKYSPGFRDRLEGWSPRSTRPNLHNRVHDWVGGDMSPATSPNDPVFYLNHCNVDRIWEVWLGQNNHTYLPDQNASTDLLSHRIDDPVFVLISPPVTPRQMLDVSNFYSYQSLNVF